MNDPPGSALFAPARWAQVRALADRLHELRGSDAADELERIAAADAELANAAGALLRQAPPGEPDALRDAVARLLPETTEPAPERIGAFRLVRRIGAGGMGTVYLGERKTTEFTQRVALKLLDGDSGRMSALVARERRVLAALSHPNITAFIDAGSDAGRAWLAMEYVEGEPLLTYCARCGLGLRERVHLFEQVCAAVAHAHSQLVVHRDLKPSNVLVSGEGTVKLLDFGIALILDPTAEQAAATRVFTPEYAAPEQLRGERVTTATDIHALGLLLFELIAGKRLPTLDQASGEEWTTTKLARNATPANAARPDIARGLRGDLGRIVAHALAPDPARRYANALALRDDLRRWREHRPIGIARPSLRYVAARFLRRNRAAVAVAVIAVLGLLGVTGYALSQAQRAQRFATNARHGRDFVLNLFKQADPFNTGNSKTSARDLLRDAAERIDTEFSDAPDTRAQMRDAVAQVLTRIGDPATARELFMRNLADLHANHGEHSPQAAVELQSLALASENAGDIDAARAQFQQAYEILRDAGTEYRAARISALTGLAKMANRTGDYARAQDLHEAVYQERLAAQGPQSPDIAMDLMNLGADAYYQEHYVQAEAFASRARDMLVHTLGSGHPRSIYVDDVLGLAQAGIAGRTAAGEETLKTAARLARAKLPPQAGIRATVIGALGSAHFLAGHDEAAIAAYQEALPLLAADKNPGVGAMELVFGRAQLRSHLAQATQTLGKASIDLIAAKGQVAGSEKLAALAQAAYGAALARDGNVNEGEHRARAGRAELIAGPFADSVILADIDAYLADVLVTRGQQDEARKLREEALAVYRRIYGAGHPQELALRAQMSGAH